MDNQGNFASFMESALKDLFGDQVSFKKVKEVDDGKNDIHISINEALPKKEWTEEEKGIIDVISDEEMEPIKHLVRKLAQQHKHELPLEGIYLAVAAHLSNESDKLLRYKLEARQKAQKEAKLKADVVAKFNDFAQSLSSDEEKALNELLNDIFDEENNEE